MDITPLTGSDIRDADDFPTIRQAFINHSVIVISDEDIAPDDHLAFAHTAVYPDLHVP